MASHPIPAFDVTAQLPRASRDIPTRLSRGKRLHLRLSKRKRLHRRCNASTSPREAHLCPARARFCASSTLGKTPPPLSSMRWWGAGALAVWSSTWSPGSPAAGCNTFLCNTFLLFRLFGFSVYSSFVKKLIKLLQCHLFLLIKLNVGPVPNFMLEILLGEILSK